MGFDECLDKVRQIIIIWPISKMIYFLSFFKVELKPNRERYAINNKGYIGEKRNASILNELDKTKYSVLNNVMIQTPRGTTQIDHVVVSNYGIFIIETKNFKGWITGSPFDDYWTQTIYKSKSRFRNPIRQNYGHEQALKAMIGTDESLRYIPLVVFSDKATFKSHFGNGVIHTSGLLTTIKEYQEELLSDITKNQIINRISYRNIVDVQARTEHVAAIRQKIKENVTEKPDNKCPKCDSELIERAGKYGKFMGCSNYPTCKFTKNLPNV